MNDIERLIAIEEIKKLKARYFRAVDTKDAALFHSLFTDDVVVDFRGSTTDPHTGTNYMPNATSEPVHGIDNVVNLLAGFASSCTSVHHGHMPEIEIASSTTARGIWPMMDVVRFVDSSSAKGFDGYGHYHETYEKVDGKWKFKTVRHTRLLLDFHLA